MKRHLVGMHQLNKVVGTVPGQGAGAKARVFRNKVLARLVGVKVDVGKVAASPTRDAHLLRQLAGMVNQDDIKALLHGNASAKEASCTSANDQYIGFKHRSGKGDCMQFLALLQEGLNHLGKCLRLVMVEHVSAILELNLTQLRDLFDAFLILLKSVAALPPSIQL